MATKSKRRIAFHEAGHAVIAAVLKIGFDSVTIVPGDYYLGCLRLLNDPDEALNRPPIQFEAYLAYLIIAEAYPIIAFAGGSAERCALDRKGRCNRPGPDLRQAREHIRDWLCDGNDLMEMRRIERRLKACADNLAKEHLPVIEKVAAALIEKGTLTEAEVMHIIENPLA